MMGYSGSGSYKVGGSLLSSNLSALAPPFKVEKSLPKPNSQNPSLNFPELPAYGNIFDPAGPLWNTCSISGPKFVATDSMGTSTTCSTSPTVYGYPGSQSGSISPAGPYYVNPNAGAAYDPFSYDELPSNMSTSAGEAANTYYPPYFSPPSQKDGYLSLGIASAPDYDLLSSSGSVHLSGHVSTQVDNAPANVGGEYKQNWGSFWSGANEGKHGKWTEYAAGFGSTDFGVSDSSVNRTHDFIDGSSKAHPFPDESSEFRLFGNGSKSSNNGHLKEGACISQDSGLKAGDSTDNCFDIFGGAYSFGIRQQDCKSSFDLNLGGTSNEGSGVQYFGPAPLCKDNPLFQESVFESVKTYFGSQEGSGSSTEEHLSQARPFVFGCTSANSSLSPTKLPYVGSSPAAMTTLSASKLNSAGYDAATKSNTCSVYDFSDQNDPQVPFGSRRQSSVIIRRPPSSMTQYSGQSSEIVDNRLHDKDNSEKVKLISQCPTQLSLDGFNPKIDDDRVTHSIEKHSGGDIHNPAEDSPCWKGASSTRFSPFGISGAEVNEIQMKKLDECNRRTCQGLQSKNPLLGYSDSINFSSDKLSESACLERAPFSTRTSNQQDCGSGNPKSNGFDLNTGDGLQFSDDYHVFAGDCTMAGLRKPESGAKISMPVEILKDEISSTRSISGNAATEKREDGLPVPEEKSGVSATAGSSNSSSPPEDISIPRSCESPRKASDSIINVNLLLETMMKLSEVLRGYCISNPAALTAQHRVTIKRIVDHLYGSETATAGKPTPVMVRSLQGNSFQKESTVSDMVNNAEEVAAAVKLLSTQEFLNSVSPKNDATLGVDNMTQAIKKILHEHFHEEVDGKGLLFRNLWLEAEAMLCALTAKSRFNRMKIEMERENDSTEGMENLPKLKTPLDVPRAGEVSSNDKISSLLGVLDQDASKSHSIDQHNHTEVSVLNELLDPNPQVVSLDFLQFEGPKSTEQDLSFASLAATTATHTTGKDLKGSGSTSHTDVVEASVMARYEVLKHRIDNPESLDCGSKQYFVEDDYLLDEDMVINASGYGSLGSGAMATSEDNDVQSSILGRYQLLKCRVDYSDSLDSESKQSPGEENYLPGNDLSSPDEHLQNSQLSNSLGVVDDNEASVMARFRIIQSRVNRSISVDRDPANEAAVENGGERSDQPPKRGTSTRNLFGPYPDFSEGEDVKEFGICVNGEGAAKCFKAQKMNSEILEGWYDNDCSSSDWEHVSKEDLRRPN